MYLSPSEEAFTLREFHHRGGDERNPFPSVGLTKDETLSYVRICLQKGREILAAETAESLQGPSGFSWRKFSRGELHIHNIRHVQHHTGQLSAYLRKVDTALQDHKAMPWVSAGWQ